jgi:hypothetical protein
MNPGSFRQFDYPMELDTVLRQDGLYNFIEFVQ